MNSRERQRVTDSSPEPFRKQLAGTRATAGLNSLFPLTPTLWPGERILRSNTRIAPLNSVPGRARLSPGRHSRNQRGRERCPQRASNVGRHSYNRELKTGTPRLRTAKSSRNGKILMYMYPARLFPWHSQLGALGTDAPYLKVHGKGRVEGKRLAHQEVLS